MQGPAGRRSSSMTLGGRRSSREATGSSNFEKWVAKTQKDEEDRRKQLEWEELQKEVPKPPEEADQLLAETAPRKSHASHLAVKDIEEVRRLFQEFDVDSSGYIDRREFVPLLSKLMRQPISEMNMRE
eukprot:4456100-Amphidinium_carterae.1